MLLDQHLNLTVLGLTSRPLHQGTTPAPHNWFPMALCPLSIMNSCPSCPFSSHVVPSFQLVCSLTLMTSFFSLIKFPTFWLLDFSQSVTPPKTTTLALLLPSSCPGLKANTLNTPLSCKYPHLCSSVSPGQQKSNPGAGQPPTSSTPAFGRCWKNH